MAVSKSTIDFLKYAKKQLEKGRDAKISAKDKVTSKYILREYSTWGEVYDAAVAQAQKEGATGTDIADYTNSSNFTVGTSHQTIEASNKDKLAPFVEVVNISADGKTREVVQKGLSVSVDATGNTILKDSNGNPNWAYLDSDGTMNVGTDYDRIRKKVLADYQAKPNGINQLFDMLYKGNVIDAATYQSKNIADPKFAQNLQHALTKYSIDIFEKRDVLGRLTVPSFEEFVLSPSYSSGNTSGSTTRTNTSIKLTTRPDSDEEINRFLMETVGLNATSKQKDDYYKVLHSAELKASVKSSAAGTSAASSDITSGTFIDSTDKLLMMGKVAANVLTGTNIDTILKGGAGAAQDINKLRTYANVYGIRLSNEDAMAMVADNLNTGQDLNSKKAKIQKLSKIKYSNLADSIDDSTSVADIAGDARYTVSKLTGMPVNTVDLNSPVMQLILSNNGKKGVMTQAESEYLIKTHPTTKQQWLNSPDAKEQAAGFALNILRTFGLMS